MAKLGRILSWWGQDYAYAAYWQVRGTLRPGKKETLRSGSQRPVVIVPGVWEPWGFLGPVIDALHRAGHPVHVVTALGRNSRPVEDSAHTVAGFITERDLHDVTIIAHSKGGLIGKHMMLINDRDGRIDKLVAIATPFGGSRYAKFMLDPTLRAFVPTHKTLRMLGANAEVNARIVSVYGEVDTHIPEGSELQGAANLSFPVRGHFRVLCDEQVLAAVEAALVQ